MGLQVFWDDGHVPRRLVGGQRSEVSLDRSVLQGVVGQHHQPPPKGEGVGGGGQEPLQGGHLIVDRDPDGLEGALGGMPRGAPGSDRDGIRDDLHEPTRRREGPGLPFLHDRGDDPLREPLLAVVTQDPSVLDRKSVV